MILPTPTERYSKDVQHRLCSALEAADRDNFKRNQDLEIGVGRIVLRAPNGSRFFLEVDNAGVLHTTPVAPIVGRST